MLELEDVAVIDKLVKDFQYSIRDAGELEGTSKPVHDNYLSILY